MFVTLSFANALILSFLGGIHLYWMLGGRWGLAQAIPTRNGDSEPMFRPGPLACVAVASGLLGFAAYNASLGLGFMQEQVLPSASKWPIRIIAGIFLLRAVGDFRYVGFFKKIKDTEFGQMDTRWYTPLCIYLGLSSAWLGCGL